MAANASGDWRRYAAEIGGANGFVHFMNPQMYRDGKEKDTDKSVIFASVATLGRSEYLNETYFPADYFDYVIIDDERVIIRTKLEKPSKIKGLALI